MLRYIFLGAVTALLIAVLWLPLPIFPKAVMALICVGGLAALLPRRDDTQP